MLILTISYFFFFNDTATTEIYTSVHTLSLHDALPISPGTCVPGGRRSCDEGGTQSGGFEAGAVRIDRDALARARDAPAAAADPAPRGVGATHHRGPAADGDDQGGDIRRGDLGLR